MYVIVVDFRIHQQDLAAFMQLVLENARVSRESEPGCRRFDVCRSQAQPERVLLYEIYDDRLAFEAHLASAHFRAFDAVVNSMVAGKSVDALDLVNR